MELATLVRIWLRRLPLIAALALLCGAAAWLVARGDAGTYQQRSSFVLRPDAGLTPEETNRAAATLENRDSAITQTIVGVLASGASPGPSTGARRKVTLRPGTNIIDVDFSGHDPAAVTASARSFQATAPDLVSHSYRIYELEPLATAAAPVKEKSTLLQTVALAVLLGCALGLGVATLEHTARARRGDEAPEGPDVAETGDEREGDRLTILKQERESARGSGAKA